VICLVNISEKVVLKYLKFWHNMRDTRIPKLVLIVVIVIVIKALQCMAGYNYSRKVNSINLIMH